MKHLFLAVVVVAFVACAKKDEAPAADSPAAAAAPVVDSVAAPMADTTVKKDTTHKM